MLLRSSFIVLSVYGALKILAGKGTGKRSTREKNCYNLSHMLKKLKGWPHTFIEQFINIFSEEVPESFD